MELPDEPNVSDTQAEIKIETDIDGYGSYVVRQTSAGNENHETQGWINICNNDEKLNWVAGRPSVLYGATEVVDSQSEIKIEKYIDGYSSYVNTTAGNNKYETYRPMNICDVDKTISRVAGCPSKRQTSFDTTGTAQFAKRKCFLCDICNRSFYKLTFLKQHMLLHVDRSHVSATCGRSFTLPAYLKRHQRVHTGGMPFKCKVCEKQYKFASILSVHMRRHTGDRPYKCKFCEILFLHRSSMKRHSFTHTGVKPHLCETCGKSFTDRISLTYHVQWVHNAQQTVKRRKCEICERRFSKSGHLLDHMRVHTGEKPYECGLCGVSFTRGGMLKKHLKTKTCVKLYSCIKCKKSFTFAGMQHHKKDVHKETKPDTDCSYVKRCERAVSSETETKGILQRLKRFDKSIISIEENSTLHYGIAETSTGSNQQEDTTKKQYASVPTVKPQTIRYKYSIGSSKSYLFTCIICNKTFEKLGYLRRHMVFHRVKRYFCDTCGKSFRFFTSLRNHKHIHTGKKPYKCDLCEKSFTSASILSRHKRHHTGDKPHRCKYCSKCFYESNDLKKHYFTHSGVQQLDNRIVSMEQNLARKFDITKTGFESDAKADERKKQYISVSGIIPNPSIKRYISSEETKHETEDPTVKLCDRAVANKIKFKGLIHMSKQLNNASKSHMSKQLKNASKSMEQSSTLNKNLKLKTDIVQSSMKSIGQVDETKNSSTLCLLEHTEMTKRLSSVTKFCNLDSKRCIALSARNKRNENV